MKKIRFAIWASLLALLAANSLRAQGFQNLDFEMAVVSTAPPDYTPFDAYPPISAADALPYWTVSEDSTVCTAVWGAPNALDETSIALVQDGNYPNFAPLQGSYSVQLYAWADAPSGFYHTASISQTGLVPAGMNSIQFLILSPPVAGGMVQASPTISFNGIPINLFAEAMSGGVITMVGDISQFAGKPAMLSINCAGTSGAPFYQNENIFALDAISFSASAVPEPNTANLILVGSLLFVFASVKAKKQFNSPPN